MSDLPTDLEDWQLRLIQAAGQMQSASMTIAIAGRDARPDLLVEVSKRLTRHAAEILRHAGLPDDVVRTAMEEQVRRYAAIDFGFPPPGTIKQ